LSRPARTKLSLTSRPARSTLISTCAPRRFSEIDQALAIRPEAYIFINRSEIRDPSDWDTRLSDVDEALRVDPKSVEALYAKADILQEKDEFAAAAEVYSQLIQHEPSSARCSTAAAWHWLERTARRCRGGLRQGSRARGRGIGP
jgi:tetratricopeptide (TPR) repeat protein